MAVISITTTILVIKPNGDLVSKPHQLPRDPGYDALRALVLPHLAPGGMERVAVLYAGNPCDMFVDDEGLIKRLPFNRVATGIYRANSMRHDPKQNPDDLPFIAGVAVLFDRKVWF